MYIYWVTVPPQRGLSTIKDGGQLGDNAFAGGDLVYRKSVHINLKYVLVNIEDTEFIKMSFLCLI